MHRSGGCHGALAPNGRTAGNQCHRGCTPTVGKEQNARTGVIPACAHGRSAPVDLALELALVLLALSLTLGLLVAGHGADGLLRAAADLVGLLAHHGPPGVVVRCSPVSSPNRRGARPKV